MAAFNMQTIKLRDASLHPPSLVPTDAEKDAEIPWVLLEERAYVADRRNDTTAVSYSRCGKQIQVSFFVARPPRVSYLCVFARCPTDTAEKEEMIAMEPEVIATDGNLILLRINVCPEKEIFDGADLYIYQPTGYGGPSLRLLERPPGHYVFNSYQVGILSCPTDDQQYIVAALCDESHMGRGRFVLYLYNSKLGTWTISSVEVEDQHFKKYQQEGYFLHKTCKVISIGGEHGTIGFVDLWQDILLCDVFDVQAKPALRYVPVPQPLQPEEPLFMTDARLYRDIAVIEGNFKYVQEKVHWERCPSSRNRYIRNGWTSSVWTRPVDACSLMDDTWQTDCDMESFRMDVESNPDFQLLPKFEGNEGTPFKSLEICQPTLSLHGDGHTVCFMVKINYYDHKAWVIAVDMKNNSLQGVSEFASERYAGLGFAYLHSRISKCHDRATASVEDTSCERSPAAVLPVQAAPSQTLASPSSASSLKKCC